MNPKLITTFVIGIAALLLVFFLVFPKFGKVQDMRKEVSEQRLNIEKILERVNSTKTAISEFQKLNKKDVDLIDKALPNGLDTPNLLVLVQSIVSSSGLILEDLTVEVHAEQKSVTRGGLQVQDGAISPRFLGAAALENLGVAGISLTVRGSYESSKAFLGALEQSLRIFDVESISFSSPKQTKEGLESFRPTLVLKTYFSE